MTPDCNLIGGTAVYPTRRGTGEHLNQLVERRPGGTGRFNGGI
jgi:hypothetical protein